MVAGDDLKRVRVIHASVDETIEIRWRRRAFDPFDTSVLPKIVDEVLIERHTAPPVNVWDAKKERPRE